MNTAVCSVLYPAMLPWLSPFLASLRAQTDQHFDLWLGLDEVSQQHVEPQLGKLAVQFMESQQESIATFRGRLLSRVCREYEAIILVDSDDVLLADRVRRAKQALQYADVSGCALQLVDQTGLDLNLTFNYEGAGIWEHDLSRLNVFGFSNSAFRSPVLEQCLPLPGNVVLVDWLVISLVLAHGGRLTFDRDPLMQYRQHPQNTAQVRTPFTPEQVTRAARLVLNHYQFLHETLSKDAGDSRTTFHQNVLRRQLDVQQFVAAIQDRSTLHHYTDSVNLLQSVYCWWEMIAHPSLESLWR